MSRQPNSSKPRVLPLEDRSVPASLSGTVYADVNGNGLRDAGEPGLAGVTALLDSGPGSATQTAVTAADGSYTFASVPAGPATVTVLPAAGTSAVGATTSTVTVTAADSAATAGGIGLRTSGQAAGTVFTDLNGNGKQDASEPGYAGATVSLDLNVDGTPEYTAASTDGTGAFAFHNVPDGVHRLTVATPVNSKITTTSTSLITITSGNSSAPLVVGVQPTSGVAGRVTLGAGGPGLANIAVGLDTNGDGKADLTATTNDQGRYVFANAPVGGLAVLLTAPAGTRFNTPDGTGKLPVTVASPAPGSASITTAPDVAVTYTGTAVGSLYLDANGNGTKDAGEAGVQPGTVQVDLNGTGKLLTVAATAQADGTFRLDGLPDGTHFVTVTPPAGTTTTFPTRVPVAIAGGSTATLTPVGVQTAGTGGGGTGGTGLGGALVLGDGAGAGVKSYTFTKNADGTLKATAGAGMTAAASGRYGTRVLSADVNGDGTPDTVTATTGSTTALIYAYDGKTGDLLTAAAGMYAFDPGFKGGVNLAAGDFNGDGKMDIVAAADTGGGPRVRVFDGSQFVAKVDTAYHPVGYHAEGQVLADFFAIDDPDFRGGVRAAAGDLNGDGKADLVVAAGAGGGPRVAVFDGQSLLPGNTAVKLVGDFFAYESSLRNGATVSVGDVNGDGKVDLVTGAGPGGAPRVTVFSGPDVLNNQGAGSARLADFFVNGNVTGRQGTSLTVRDVDGDGKADVVATNAGKAYVYTGTGLTATGQQKAAAVLDAFGDPTGVNVG